MSDKSYDNLTQMSDAALLGMIGAFIKHHRVQQQMSQEQVAAAAGISRSTLSLLERGEVVTLSTLIQVLRVLDLLHMIEAFEITEEISPLAYAKLKKQTRQRVRSKKKSNDQEDLGW